MRGESVCAVGMRRAVRWTRAATARATRGHEIRSWVGAHSAYATPTVPCTTSDQLKIDHLSSGGRMHAKTAN
eukprot:767824-Prymnesium_polylepis.1